MAIYSRFGATADLHRRLRDDGFVRLAEATAAVVTSDPVTSLAAAALAYLEFGVARPHLYRFMFVDPPPTAPEAVSRRDEAAGDTGGRAAFGQLGSLIESCVTAGRFASDDPRYVVVWSAELWALQHGVTTLALTGTIPADLARHVMIDGVLRLVIGFGDDSSDAERSVRAATRGGD